MLETYGSGLSSQKFDAQKFDAQKFDAQKFDPKGASTRALRREGERPFLWRIPVTIKMGYSTFRGNLASRVSLALAAAFNTFNI